MGFDREYVAARRVLLDALEALGEHREASTLVGAQAVYLRVGEGELAIAPFTTDADVLLDPRTLDDEPRLAPSLRAGGFEIAVNPGTWTRDDVQVDFLVPEALGGAGRRGARLGPHGSEVARKARGLEAAAVDRSMLRVKSLERGDPRVFDIAVASVAALLVAKLHKIHERRHDADRLSDKDALDVLRILSHGTSAELARSLMRLQSDALSEGVTREARAFLDELFSSRAALGATMAVRSSAGLADGEQIALSCEVLASELLALWK